MALPLVRDAVPLASDGSVVATGSVASYHPALPLVADGARTELGGGGRGRPREAGTRRRRHKAGTRRRRRDTGTRRRRRETGARRRRREAGARWWRRMVGARAARRRVVLALPSLVVPGRDGKKIRKQIECVDGSVRWYVGPNVDACQQLEAEDRNTRSSEWRRAFSF
jgi:hypothetical protein